MSAAVVVRDMETGAEVKRIDVSGMSERQADRVEMGVLMQMNRDKYTVGIEDA